MSKKISLTQAAKLHVAGQLPVGDFSSQQRLAFLNKALEEYGLHKKDLTTLLGYGESHVYGWFVKEDSDRFRSIPDRALETLFIKISGGLVRKNK